MVKNELKDLKIKQTSNDYYSDVSKTISNDQNMTDLIRYIDDLRTRSPIDLSYRDVFFKNLKSYIA